MFNFRPFEVSPESTPKLKLIAVLNYLEVLIKEIIQKEQPPNLFESATPEGDFWSKVVDGDLLVKMSEAWPDIKMRIEKAKSRLAEMGDDAAYAHGLSGPELDLKLSSLSWASRELFFAVQTKTPSSGPKKSKRLASLFKKNFEVIEVIIGSILEATGAKTALKEIVQVLTHMFKDFNKK